MAVRIQIKFWPRPRVIVNQGLPESAIIKKWAHAVTVFTVAWTGLSVMAAFAYKYGKEDGDHVWISTAIWFWRIHVAGAILSGLLWLIEKPSKVRYVEENSEDET